jgi:outer membrane protein
MTINLKTRFLLGLMTCMFAAANAQTEMGNFLLNSSSDMEFAVYSLKVKDSYSNDDAGKLSMFGFNSGAGYFIANNLALGLQFTLTHKSEKEDGDEFTELTRMFLPFARLYFGSKNMKPFVQAAYGTGLNRTSEHYTEEEYITGYEIDGGLAFFLSKNISIDFLVGYGSLTLENDDSKTSGRGIGGSIGISVIF